MSGETTRTRPHRQAEGLLDRLGFSYQSEYTEFPPYQLDLYLGEWHLCIEIDGMGHHKNSDDVRDAKMWELYRVPTLRLKADKKIEWEPAIRGFVERWADDAEIRRSHARS